MTDKEKLDKLLEAVKPIIPAASMARIVTKPGCGVGGQTIDANIRSSMYNGFDAWVVQDLINTYYEVVSDQLTDR
jgi:hypothetical protein